MAEFKIQVQAIRDEQRSFEEQQQALKDLQTKYEQNRKQPSAERITNESARRNAVTVQLIITEACNSFTRCGTRQITERPISSSLWCPTAKSAATGYAKSSRRAFLIRRRRFARTKPPPSYRLTFQPRMDGR